MSLLTLSWRATFNMSDASLIYDEIAFAAAGRLAQLLAMAPGRTWPQAEAIGLAASPIRPLLRIDYIWHSDGPAPRQPPP